MQFYCRSEARNRIRVIMLLFNILYTEALEQRIPGFIDIAGDFGSERFDISSNCSNVPGNGTTVGLRTLRICVNLFTESNCEGGLVRLQPADMFSTIEKLQIHRWNEQNNRVSVDSMKISSVGPCYNKCDPRNWEGVGDEPQHFTIYDETDYIQSEGRPIALTVKGEECIQLPQSLKSIKMAGEPSSSCIELHHDPNCRSDNYTQLRSGYPQLHDLWHYGMGPGRIVINAKAVSRCGTNCNKSLTLGVKPEIFTRPGKNMITGFDQSGYNDESHLNISGGVCVNLENHGFGWLSTIYTYGQCVMLYKDGNCTTTFGYYPKHRGGFMEYHSKKRTISIILPRTIKSLRGCRDQDPGKISVDGGNQPNRTPVSKKTFPLIEKTTKEIRVVEPVESEEKETCDNSFPAWATVLLCLGGLLFISLSGVMIYLFNRVKRSNPNPELFTVLYEPKS